MSPDDERHGTTAGYSQGCRLICCRAAHARWAAERRKSLYLLRIDRLHVDPTGTRRRIQALMAIGWSLTAISRALGHQETYAGQLCRHDTILRSTADKVARLYEQMSMTLPDTSSPFKAAIVARNIRVARDKGYIPPLGWDDIDDPDEQPTGWQYRERKLKDTTPVGDIDEVVVRRLLDGHPVEATKAEKEAAVAQWVRDGCGPISELARMHGWGKPERYTRHLRLVGEAS